MAYMVTYLSKILESIDGVSQKVDKIDDIIKSEMKKKFGENIYSA